MLPLDAPSPLFKERLPEVPGLVELSPDDTITFPELAPADARPDTILTLPVFAFADVLADESRMLPLAEFPDPETSDNAPPAPLVLVPADTSTVPPLPSVEAPPCIVTEPPFVFPLPTIISIDPLSDSAFPARRDTEPLLPAAACAVLKSMPPEEAGPSALRMLM